MVKIIVIEMSLFSLFLLFLIMRFDKSKGDLIGSIIITLAIGPIMYFVLLHILIELSMKKDKIIDGTVILVSSFFLLLILLILTLLEISHNWYKVYIVILLITVFQILITIKFIIPFSKDN